MALAEIAKLVSALVSFCVLSWGVYNFIRRRKEKSSPIAGPTPTSRGKFRVAVIDDEVASRFDPVAREALRGRGFSIDYLADIRNVSELDRYSIVLCDIKGVGRNFGVDGNGHGGIIVSELRKCRPLIYIAIYSAETYNPSFNRFFDLADEVMDKGSVKGEAIVDLLDRAIMVLGSPNDLWKRFKRHVLGRLTEEIDTERMRKIQRGFMKVASEGEVALDRILAGIIPGLPGDESGAAELAVSTSDAAERLIELFN